MRTNPLTISIMALLLLTACTDPEQNEAPAATKAEQQMARTCESNPDPATALQACDGMLRTTQSSENRAITLSNRAWALDELGRTSEALSAVKQALAGHPAGGRAAAWNMRGTIERRLGDLPSAELSFVTALERLSDQDGERISAGSSTAFAARANLAEIYHSLGREGEARIFANEAYTIRPDDAQMQPLYAIYVN